MAIVYGSGDTAGTQLRPQYDDVLDAARAIWQHTQGHEGGTFAASTGELNEYTSGYVVALGQGTALIATDEREDVAVALIAAYIQQQPINARTLCRPNIGTWTHEGLVYVDAVELVEDRQQALALAAQRGELAIWDNAAGEEISV